MNKFTHNSVSIFLSACLLFGFSACNKNNTIEQPPDNSIEQNSDLTFVLSEDKTYYILTDVKSSIQNVLSIPATYKNLPVREIAERAGEYTPYLTHLTIPDSVYSIGAFAFDQCFSLTEVIIGASVKYIGSRAFSCSTGALTRVTFVTPIGWTNSSGQSVDFSSPTQSAEILGGSSSYLVYTRS